jgi:UDP-N-acetylmuramoyl-L-alanyl-D-glutamate--2,6-diaminopimelate ligase
VAVEEIVKLGDLCEGLPLSWGAGVSPDLEVSGVCHDSRLVEPGDLFVAWRGEVSDGQRFAADAAVRGAVAMLVESCGEQAPLPCLEGARPRALLGALASRLYEHPDRELRLVGVTGTNGKSTVVSLVAAMLDAAQQPAARLGTLGYHFGGERFPGDRTTPEGDDLFHILRQVRSRGGQAAVMEVSSHGLAQGRVEGAAYDVAVFINLTRDHLDFHHTLESYFAAKATLFEKLKPGGHAVVGIDDAWGARLAARLEHPLTFGAEGDVRFDQLSVSARGIEGEIATPRGTIRVRSPLLGDYNVENLLAATATAVALELPAAAIEAAIAGHGPVPGRLESVECGQGFPVLVDFAHTDGALSAALRSARSLDAGRVMVVFGCGGERDRGKRPLMGRAAAELADYAILTSDNPRGEAPEAILEEVEVGVREVEGARYEVVPDRRQAIRRALELAGPGWVVVIAGKGHEEEQIVGSRRLPFVDRDEVARVLGEELGTTTTE